MLTMGLEPMYFVSCINALAYLQLQQTTTLFTTTICGNTASKPYVLEN